MWTRLLLLSGFAVSIPTAVRAQDDPQELLLRVRTKLNETIGRLPKYMCTLSVDRCQYQVSGIHGSPSCDALLAEKEKGHLKPRLF